MLKGNYLLIGLGMVVVLGMLADETQAELEIITYHNEETVLDGLYIFDNQRVVQDGGTLDSWLVSFSGNGNSTYSPQYTLQGGGELNVDSLSDIFLYQPFLFEHQSGVVNAGQIQFGSELSLGSTSRSMYLSLSVNPSEPVSRKYNFTSGQINTDTFYLGNTQYTQYGGNLNAGLMNVDEQSSIMMRGGNWSVGRGLNLEGELAIINTSSELQFDKGIVNLSKGMIRNGENLTLSGGAESLLIVNAGQFNQLNAERGIDTNGFVHIQGAALNIPTARSITGEGIIQDFVVARGVLDGRGDVGIGLQNGLYVTQSGDVNLGSGHLDVMRPGSGINGGVLDMKYLNLYRAEGTFSIENPVKSGIHFDHVSGEVNVAESVHLDSGYRIHDGELNAKNITIYNQQSWLDVVGGEVNVANRLSVHGHMEIDGGEVDTRLLEIGEPESVIWGGIEIGLVIPVTEYFHHVSNPDVMLNQGSIHTDSIQMNEGRFQISGGEVQTGQFVVNMQGDVSQFVLSGGEVSVNESFEMSNGRVLVDGGEMNVAAMMIGQVNPEFQSGNIFSFTSRNVTSEFVQNSGVVNVEGGLMILDHAYVMNGGELNAMKIELGDATLGWSNRLPTNPGFIQNGGVVNVAADLGLCVPGWGWNPTPINVELFPPFEELVYEMNGGELNVGGDVIVGSQTDIPARFVQRGGEITVGGAVRVEGETSSYTMSGGVLKVQQLFVGHEDLNTGGMLTLNSSNVQVEVQDKLLFGRSSSLRAVQGAEIHVTGDTIEFQSTNAAKMRGMQNLTLRVTAGERAGQGGGTPVTTLEVASADMGMVDGFDAYHYVLGKLIVGDGENDILLQLVDLYDNSAGDAAEALYVRELTLLAGATLDLNGLNLYYLEGEIDPLAEIINGVGQQLAALTLAVPEPGVGFGLLLMGLGGVRRGRGRKRAA